jgi:hypothetical protein
MLVPRRAAPRAGHWRALRRLAVEADGCFPAVGLAAAKDPQTLLDQSATLDYITSQGSDQERAVLQALQETVRTRKAAQDRLTSVKQLTDQLDKQRKHIQGLLAKAGVTPAKPKGQPGGKSPAVARGGASATALRAVRRRSASWAARMCGAQPGRAPSTARV